MLVKNWMHRPVLTVSPKASMYMARELMDQNHIRALPVVNENRLVGLLTDRHLKRAEASDATSLDTFELAYLLKKLEVAKIMTTDPITIDLNGTLSEAAGIFLENKLDALPVMEGGRKLVGILTLSDLQRAFLTLTAFKRRGVQFGMRLEDTPGVLMGIIDVIRQTGARLASLITADPSDVTGMRDVYFHINEVNREKMPDLMAELRQKGELLYIVDLRMGERQIFDR